MTYKKVDMTNKAEALKGFATNVNHIEKNFASRLKERFVDLTKEEQIAKDKEKREIVRILNTLCDNDYKYDEGLVKAVRLELMRFRRKGKIIEPELKEAVISCMEAFKLVQPPPTKRLTVENGNELQTILANAFVVLKESNNDLLNAVACVVQDIAKRTIERIIPSTNLGHRVKSFTHDDGIEGDYLRYKLDHI